MPVGCPTVIPGGSRLGNDSYTKIMLHFDGTNGGTTFPDTAYGQTAVHTWTGGGGAALSNTTSKFGPTSFNCGAGVSWIETPDSNDFTIATGDWTVDFWWNRQGGDGTFRDSFGQLDSTSTPANVSIFGGLNSSNVCFLAYYNTTTQFVITGTTTFTTTGWHHYAAVRTGNILRMFVDGVQEGGDSSFSGSINNSSFKFAVGRAGEATANAWNGYLDEFRLSVGIARWTSNFTPPSGPYG